MFNYNIKILNSSLEAQLTPIFMKGKDSWFMELKLVPLESTVWLTFLLYKKIGTVVSNLAANLLLTSEIIGRLPMLESCYLQRNANSQIWIEHSREWIGLWHAQNTTFLAGKYCWSIVCKCSQQYGISQWGAIRIQQIMEAISFMMLLSLFSQMS